MHAHQQHSSSAITEHKEVLRVYSQMFPRWEDAMSATVNSTFPDPTTDFAEARKEGEKALNSASASASKFASGAKATATDFASNAA